MKKSPLSLVSLVFLAACGSGGGGESPAPTAAVDTPAPSPSAPSPSPAVDRTPPTTIAPAPQPSPAPAPVAGPPAAKPPAAQPPPAQPPPAVPSLSGVDLAYMMQAITIPTHGGPNFIQPELEAHRSMGTVYGYQFIGEGYYNYNSGPGPKNEGAGINPYFYFTPFVLTTQFSYQNGQAWFGPNMRVRYNFYSGDAGQAIDLQLDGGFYINPEDQLPLNTTIAQWSATDGSPYYVQLQTGTYGVTNRHCWHVRIPGILRQTCTLWKRVDGQWRYTGDYIVDDSNQRLFEPVTFVGVW